MYLLLLSATDISGVIIYLASVGVCVNHLITVSKNAPEITSTYCCKDKNS